MCTHTPAHAPPDTQEGICFHTGAFGPQQGRSQLGPVRGNFHLKATGQDSRGPTAGTGRGQCEGVWHTEGPVFADSPILPSYSQSGACSAPAEGQN